MTKYDVYKEMGDIWFDIAYVRHWLNVIFSSLDFQNNARYYQDHLNQLEFGTEEAVACDNYLGKQHNVLRILKELKKVSTQTEGYPIQFKLSTSPHNLEANNKAIGIIKSFFPEFEVPIYWKLASNSKGVLAVEPLFKQQKTSVPLSKLLNKKVEYRPDPRASESDKLHIPSIDEGKGHFVDHIYVNPVIESCECDIPVEKVSDSSGTLKGMYGTLTFNMRVFFDIHFPIDYALWATYSKNLDNFAPTQFLSIVNQNAAFNFVEGAPEPINRIKSLSSIKTENDKLVTKGIRTIRSRTNEDGFIMLRNGRIVWLPNADNVLKYEETLRKSFDPKTGIAKSAKEMNLINKPIYLDWLKNIYTYINGEGNLDYMRLSGGIPLSKQTIARLLNSPITLWGEDFFNILGTHFKEPISFSVRSGITTQIYVKEIFGYLPQDMVWGQLGGGKPLDENNKYLEPLIVDLHKIFEKAALDFNKIECSLISKMLILRICIVMLTKYSKMLPEYEEAYENSKKINSYRIRGSVKDIEVVNMPGLTSLMPHQSRDAAELQTHPENVMLSVDPGGGKTLLIISYIMNLYKTGKAKRAAVIMPDGLIKQFADEINTFSKGKINVFPFKTSIMDRLSSSLNLDVNGIKSLVRKMPQNTIFLIGYNFIKNKRGIDGIKKEDFLYCTKQLPSYPNVELLNELDFDAIICDESHKIKNLNSQVSSSVAQVLAQAKIKVLASGTQISKDVSDYVGQMSVIEPTVFGDKDQFNERYGEDSISSVGGREQAIVSSMLPYVKRIVNKRREWAPFLPRLIEYSHPVRLNTDQQEFYENLLSKAFAEMMEDPRYKKLLRSVKPEDQEKMESAFEKYLANVEIFVNAPDGNDAFVQLHGKKLENLTSPKVDKINELLDAHFYGGVVDGWKVEKSENKVIIFVYNVAVAPHVFNHIKYKNQAVLMLAGDDDKFQRFLHDPTVKILVATESSIKEGFNAQIADCVIRVQCLWSPGDHEQALARAMRPDPKNKFNREHVGYHVIYTEFTLEVAKWARMFSRIISKARCDEYGQPGWHEIDHQIQHLELITMNLDVIKQYKTDKDLNEYWEGYEKYRTWEAGQFHKILEGYKSEYKKEFGKDPTRQDLMKHIMVETKHEELPNSRRAYVPLVEGMVSPIDKHGLGLKPLTLVESAGEEDDSDEGKEIIVGKGDHVWTEFGPGQVVGISSKVVKVKVEKLGEVKLPKSIVYVAEDFGNTKSPKQNKLKDLHLSNKSGSLTLKPGTVLTQKESTVEDLRLDKKEKTSPKEVGKNDKVKSIKIKRVRKEEPELDVFPAVMNNQIALYSYADKDTTALVGSSWRYNDAFLYCTIKSKTGLENLMEALQKKFKVGSAYVEQMDKVEKKIQGTSGRFMQNLQPINMNNINNFFRVNIKPITGKNIRPYPLVWGGTLHVAFSSKNHQKVLSKIRSIQVPGISTWKLHNPIVIKFFSSVPGAVNEMKKLKARGVKIGNYDNALRELKGLKAK